MRQRLHEALRHALRVRDEHAGAALRSAMAAIDNAESVGRAADPKTEGAHVAKVRLGVGSAETERRRLSPEDLAAVVRSEIDERRSAAQEYERLGRLDHAARLRAEAAALAPFLTQPGSGGPDRSGR